MQTLGTAPKTRLNVAASTERLSLIPGQPGTVSISATNLGREIDKIVAVVEGLDPFWYAPRDATVRLFPTETGTFEFTVTPPAEPAAPEGDVSGSIRISSTVDPTSVVTLPLAVHVLPLAEMIQEGLEARLTPQKVTTGTRGSGFTLELENTGNVEHLVDLAVEDDRNGLVTELEHDRLALGPGEKKVVRLHARPRRFRVFAKPETFPFRVTATKTDVSTFQTNVDVVGMAGFFGRSAPEPIVTARGELTYRPAFAWLVIALEWFSRVSIGVVVLAVVGILVVWFLGPSMSPGGTSAAPGGSGVASGTAGPSGASGTPGVTGSGVTVPGGVNPDGSPAIPAMPGAADGAAGSVFVMGPDGVLVPVTAPELLTAPVDLGAAGVAPAGTPPAEAVTVTPTPDAAEVTPTPEAALPRIVRFEMGPSADAPGELELRWETDGAEMARLRELLADGTSADLMEAASGVMPMTTTGTPQRVFELEASGPGGTVVRPLTVMFVPGQATATPLPTATAQPTLEPSPTTAPTQTATPVPSATAATAATTATAVRTAGAGTPAAGAAAGTASGATPGAPSGTAVSGTARPASTSAAGSTGSIATQTGATATPTRPPATSTPVRTATVTATPTTAR